MVIILTKAEATFCKMYQKCDKKSLGYAKSKGYIYTLGLKEHTGPYFSASPSQYATCS